MEEQGNDMCEVCGADKQVWKWMLHEEHYCDPKIDKTEEECDGIDSESKVSS